MDVSTHDARPSTAAALTPPVRIGVIGVGRIGRMHAELLARRIPSATLAAVFDARAESAAAVGAELGVPVTGVGRRAARRARRRRRRDLHEHRHARRPDRRRRARPARRSSARSRSRSTSTTVDRALTAVEAAGVPFQIGFNRRFDPAHAVRRAPRSPTGQVGDPHLVRITSRDPAPPPLSYVRVSGGIFLDMTIHDFDMARFVTGTEVVEVYARGAVRVDPSFAEAGDVDTAVVVLVHENGCLTSIDNSRRAVYGYDQRVEVFGSDGHGGVARTRSRTRGDRAHGRGRRARPTLPYFFLERYIPSYVREWEAFVARARRRRDAAGHDGRRARAARHRPRGVALAARGAAGPPRRGRRRDARGGPVRRPAPRRQGRRGHRQHAGVGRRLRPDRARPATASMPRASAAEARAA